jgi:hypothetical protein
MQRILASMKTCCGRAVWCARPLYDLKVADESSHQRARKFQVIENRENRDFDFAQWKVTPYRLCIVLKVRLRLWLTSIPASFHCCFRSTFPASQVPVGALTALSRSLSMPSRFASQAGLRPSHSALQGSGDSLSPHRRLAREQAMLSRGIDISNLTRDHSHRVS